MNRNNRTRHEHCQQAKPSYSCHDPALSYLKNNKWNGVRLLNLSEPSYLRGSLDSTGSCINKFAEDPRFTSRSGTNTHTGKIIIEGSLTNK